MWFMRGELMRRVCSPLVSIAAVIITFMPSQGRSQTPPPRTEIAAWNIEWLGPPHNRSGAGKDVAQSPQDIADYIKASKANILAVEEISFNDGDDNKRQNKTLTAACVILNGPLGNQWKHRLFAKHDVAAKDQCVGLVWN